MRSQPIMHFPRSSRECSQAHASRRRGSAIVFVVLFLVIVLGFVGLGLDSGSVLSAKQQLQAAADAAALAGAALVETDPTAGDPSTPYQVTRQAAVDIAASNQAAKSPVQLNHNYGNTSAGDIVVGTWDATTNLFTPGTTSPNAVKVTARRNASAGGGPLDLLFGQAFSKPTVDLERTAIATSGFSEGPAILVLDPSGDKAFSMLGTPRLNATGKIIHINSSAGDAFYMNGSPDDPRCITKATRVHGGAAYPLGAAVPPPTVNSWIEPDYLMYLPDHPDPLHTLPNYGTITGPGTYDPGWYPQGVDFNDGVAQLLPGIYVIGPPGIDLKGDAQMIGEGVMLFLDLGGKLKIAGTGDAGLDLSAPTSGLYEGVVFYQHRQNGTLCDIQGGGLFDLHGTMYLKTARLEMDGNVHRTVGRIVVFRQQIRGTATYDIPGWGPPPTGPKTVYLVN
jgi:Flp pilus assembly protein TadG